MITSHLAALFIGFSVCLGLCGLLPGLPQKRVWWLAVILQSSLAVFAVFACTLVFKLGGESGFAAGSPWTWSPSWDYSVVPWLDGLSAPLLLVLSLVYWAAVVFLRSEQDQAKYAIGTLGFLQAANYAAIFSRDLFPYTAFGAAAMLPTAFLIGLDSEAQRSNVARRYIFSEILVMLFLLLNGMGFHPHYSARIGEWLGFSAGAYEIRPQSMLFGLFLAAILIRSQLFPLNTYVRGALQLRRPAASLAVGTSLLVGVYGLFRFVPVLFPKEIVEFSWLMCGWALVAIVAAAFTMTQERQRRARLAQSVSLWTGLVVLGFSSLRRESWVGALLGAMVLQIVITLGAGIAWAEERRRISLSWSRMIRKPRFAIAWVFSELSAHGFPLTLGFFSVVLIWWGAAELRPWIGAIAVVLFPALLLSCLRALSPPATPRESDETYAGDLNRVETVVFSCMVAFLLAAGLAPNFLVNNLARTAQAILRLLEQTRV